MEEMRFVQEITLDIFEKNSVIINAKQGDGKAGFVRVHLSANGMEIKAERSWTASIRARKRDGHGVWNKAQIEDDGTILFELTRQTLACPGMTPADVNLRMGDASETTMTFWLDVEPAPIGDKMESKDELKVLVQATEKAAEATEAANKAAGEANTAANKAREATEATLEAAGEAAAAAGTAAAAAGKANAAAGAANDAAEKAKELAAHPDTARNGTWWAWDVETHQYIDTGERACLNYDVTYASVAEMEADATNQTPGTVAIISTDVSLEDNAKTYVKRADGTWGFLADLSGFPGVGIESITLSEGDHSPGTTDTYTIRLTDGREVTVLIYNGADGQVRSVNGQTGAVTLTAGDVGAYTKAEADKAVQTVKAAMPRCWALTVQPGDWASVEDPMASKQGSPDHYATMQAVGALATDNVASIVCTGGDDASAAQWQYLTVDDGTITLWSEGAPAGEIDLVVTVMPGTAAGGG